MWRVGRSWGSGLVLDFVEGWRLGGWCRRCYCWSASAGIEVGFGVVVDMVVVDMTVVDEVDSPPIDASPLFGIH